MPAEPELTEKATWHERYRVRRVSWLQIGGTALVCSPILLIRSVTSQSSTDVLPFVRLTSVALAAVSVYALDDPARALTETSCPGRLRLRAESVALTFAVVTAVWLPLVWISARIAAPTPPLRIPGLYVELLALSATGWAIGAVMASSPTARFVPARAAGLLAMIVAVTLTTPRTMHWFWVGPGTEWNPSHAKWACVAGVALAMFAWVSRDPACTRIDSRLNRRTRSPRLRDEGRAGRPEEAPL